MITLTIPELIQNLIPNVDEAFTLDIVRMNTTDNILTVNVRDINMGFKIRIYDHELSDITKLSRFTESSHKAAGRIHLKKMDDEDFEVFRIEMDDLSENQETTEVIESEPAKTVAKPTCSCGICQCSPKAPSSASGISFSDRPKTKY